MVATPNIFSHAPIDRAAHRRLDTDWLAAHADLPGLYIWQGMVAVQAERLAWLPASLPGIRLFLGMHAGRPVFAILGEGTQPSEVELANLRDIGMRLPAVEAGLAATALAYANWHARHKFCGLCSALLDTVDAGHRKHCPACQADHFPRTDPAIIVLVTHGERALLARNHKYPPGRWSTLAGFVEPGESLEDTVRREMAEEVNVTLQHITYRSSQPWPFPGSLMLGFYAEAEGLTMAPDGVEITDAQWVTRTELQALQQMPESAFSLPNPLSISRRLIDDWARSEGY